MVGGISGWQLLILLLIVVLVFGTKRLRNIGSDLGSAVRGFRKGMEDDDKDGANSEPEQLQADPPPSPEPKPAPRTTTETRPPGTDV